MARKRTIPIRIMVRGKRPVPLAGWAQGRADPDALPDPTRNGKCRRIEPSAAILQSLAERAQARLSRIRGDWARDNAVAVADALAEQAETLAHAEHVLASAEALRATFALAIAVPRRDCEAYEDQRRRRLARSAHG